MNPHNGDMDEAWRHGHPGGQQLSDYLDHELSPQERAATEAHVATCASCAALLSELRLVTARARDLAVPAEPQQDLWPGVQKRLGRAAPAEMAAARQGWWRPTLRGWVAGRAALAVAATLLVACAVTVVWLLSDPRTWRATRGAAAVATPVVSEQQDTETLAALRRAVHGSLTGDPRVLDVIEENLAVIDVAIAEYREALANAPGDADLARRLEAAQQRKLAVLRQAAELAPEGPE